MTTTTATVGAERGLSPHRKGHYQTASKGGLKYRPDIDGLRAVAVLSVLAFHIGLSRCKGGYVGVDVFFVISGYLISSIILTEISASHFSIVAFYERRIRRIFPALFAMLAASTVAATIYLLPSELVGYAKSMLAATGSASNIYFWRHSGYFFTPTSKPLLQTWSLAVEEQFYLSFPLFLLLVRRFLPRMLRTAVIVLFFVSLIISCYVVVRNPDTAFYMPYTRAWELLLGTILSLGLFPKLGSTVLRNIATATGIVMILSSVVLYSERTLFPGASALLPCVGCALIIWAGETGGSLVGAFLSWRPVVFVGLISYSLYLWHWPIIVLRRMGMFGGIGGINLGFHLSFLSAHRLDMVFEVVLSLALAVLSWRFVETPFRTGALRLSGRPLFALTGGVMAVLVGAATWTIVANGFPWRFPTKALQVASILNSQVGSQYMRTGTCFITTNYHFDDYNPSTCLHENKHKRNFLLLGDSHSAMLWSALATELRDANVMQASTADCLPTLAPSGRADCRKMMSYIFQNYLPTHPVQGLFLAGRWDQESIGPLTELITWAKQHDLEVVVFGPVPEYDAPLPRLLAYSIAWKEPQLARKDLVTGPRLMDTEMQRDAAELWHVKYISLYREICRDGHCLEYADAARTLPLMGDDNHLSGPGASLVIQRLADEGEFN